MAWPAIPTAVTLTLTLCALAVTSDAESLIFISGKDISASLSKPITFNDSGNYTWTSSSTHMNVEDTQLFTYPTNASSAVKVGHLGECRESGCSSLSYDKEVALLETKRPQNDALFLIAMTVISYLCLSTLLSEPLIHSSGM